MKVIAQTAALQEALALTGSIVLARSPKPILKCVKLIAANDVLTILSTDLEVGCRYQVSSVKIEEEGEALLPADRLSGIVRESTDESLTLETDKDACVIKGAGSRFRIHGYDPGEYPSVGEFEGDPNFQIPSAVLSDMISKTLFATAKAHSHYAISGVLWEADGKKLQLVATDGHRLAQTRGALAKSSDAGKAIVPGKLMGLLHRIGSEAEEMFEVKFEENQILLRTPRATLVGQLVQGNFPNYADVIPKESTIHATVEAGQLEHRLRQAALLTDEESRGVKLTFESKTLTLTGRGAESGEAEATCPIELDGEGLSIGFNPTFLLDALRVVDTETVVLGMNTPGKPAVMKSGKEFLYVLMPVDLG